MNAEESKVTDCGQVTARVRDIRKKKIYGISKNVKLCEREKELKTVGKKGGEATDCARVRAQAYLGRKRG